MLILILINVQYLQKVVFRFEKGLNGQNHSSGSHNLTTPLPPLQNFQFPPPLRGGIFPLPTPKCYLENHACLLSIQKSNF